MADTRDDSFFQQKGKSWFNKPFYNNILSTNIAVWRYLADSFFDGDLTRIVWSSPDMMFRKRQQQVAAYVQQGKADKNAGVLDMPFCAFRLDQDSASVSHERTWFNQALNTKGMWIEELGRYVRLTPATFNYTGILVCQNDIDLQYITHKMLWNDSNETLLESFIDTEAEDGTSHTLKNIIVCSTTTHMNPDYTDSDWLQKNKIQTIRRDMTCGTWIMNEDLHNYWITKKVVLDFAEDASIPIHEEIPIEETVKLVFTDQGAWGGSNDN